MMRSPTTRGTPSSAPPSVMREALITFAVLSLVAGIIITVATLVAAERIARSIALDDAQTQAVGVATRLAAPLVDERVRAGVPGASDQLTAVMANRMRDGSIRHVKLWNENGRIIWSDETELVGGVFALSPEVTELFGTQDVSAELSDLSREENVAERDEGELLEVYVGTFDADGAPLVFESYLATEAMDETASTILTPFAALIVGSLLLFLVIVLPFAVSLSRRVERSQAERATIMRHALQASELERRRIADELHSGVVQELAGLGYTLPAVIGHLENDGDLAKARSLLDRAIGLVQHNITSLRSLMTDIYPPDLRGPGLRYAVLTLVRTEATNAGLEAHVEVDDELVVPIEAGTLAYRIIREGVRNVVKHADAHEVFVELTTDGVDLTVRVVDDGRGPGPHPGLSPDGHLGLRILTDSVGDVGGLIQVRPLADGGTSLFAQFPLAFSSSGPHQDLSKARRRVWHPRRSR